MGAAALRALRAACDDPGSTFEVTRAAGLRIVRTAGSDAPHELIRAAGGCAVALRGAMSATPLVDSLIAPGSPGLSSRGRALLEQILGESSGPVVLTHAEHELSQLFATLRELRRTARIALPPFRLLDLRHLPRPSSATYNRARLRQCAHWLGRELDATVLDRTIALCAEQTQLMSRIDTLRTGVECRLRGADVLRISSAARVLPPERHVALMGALLAEADSLPLVRPTTRLLLCGIEGAVASLYDALEARGILVVGELHDELLAIRQPLGTCADALGALADPQFRRPNCRRSSAERAAQLQSSIALTRPDRIAHVSMPGDDASPWDAASERRVAEAHGIPYLALRLQDSAAGALALERLHEFASGAMTPPHSLIVLPPRPSRSTAQEPRRSPAAAPRSGEGATPSAGAARTDGPTRSRKSLTSVSTFNVFQREWFAEVRARVAAGSPFAVANANAPQEILRAMDIPFVVNQWWASIVAAKQQSQRYTELLAAHDHPTDINAYSAQGLAAAYDMDAAAAPWGGLPRPDVLLGVAQGDEDVKLFAHWAQASGAELFHFERSHDARLELPLEWWDVLHEGWDRELEPERLDLMSAELEQAVALITRRTGRTLDRDRLREVMELVNEQEDAYRRTRDLIARSVPAPVGVVDTMPATMVPQWHRGSVWARDAARAFHDEVAQRVAAGAAVAADERLRLMWVGRGLWSNMAFYQRWEASHGAVFVWSMYLALAADGYIRRLSGGRDPLRALASRFVTMGDELRMPTWAGAWHVREAERHAVDGAVALADADPFVLRALREAGVPVFELGLDNFTGGDGLDAALDGRIRAFLEGPAETYARRRRA